MTPAQGREAIATKFPPELQALARELASCGYSDGFYTGRANLPFLDPFGPVPPPPLDKVAGKKR